MTTPTALLILGITLSLMWTFTKALEARAKEKEQ